MSGLHCTMAQKGGFIQCQVNTDLDEPMLYTPEYFNLQNEVVEAELSIHVKTSTSIKYVVVKGKLAGMFALNLNEGKEMCFIIDCNHIITDFTWGRDNKTTLRREISDWDWEGPGFGISTGEGCRPKDWNQPDSPGNHMWKAMLGVRKNTTFNITHIRTRKFGFARVIMPEQYRAIVRSTWEVIYLAP